MRRLLILSLALGLANCIEYGESSHEQPLYSYEYAVHDPKTGNTHSRKEERKGGSTQGEYSVVEADGSKRLVQYTVHGKGGYSAQLDHGDSSYKSSGELKSYYKAGSSYESSSSLKSAGFLESLPSYKGFKPSYESSYKAPLQSYKPSYSAPSSIFKPSYQSSLSSSKPSYQAPLTSYKPSYQAPLSSFPRYQDPTIDYKPNYNAPEKRPFVPIFEPGYKPVLPSLAFPPSLVIYQPTERAGYKPFAGELATVPPDYQSTDPSYQSPLPSYQSAIPNYQSSLSSYQSGLSSYNKPAFSDYKPSFPSYKSSIPSYEPSFPSYEPAVPSYKAASPSYKPNYGEGTATSSVSFSTKGAKVITSTKHILPPKKHY